MKYFKFLAIKDDFTKMIFLNQIRDLRHELAKQCKIDLILI